MKEANTAIINGVVCRIAPGFLLICDCQTGERVVVHTKDNDLFCKGDRVWIQYRGSIGEGIPPQINVSCIAKQNRALKDG
jgi:hypothetical protein